MFKKYGSVEKTFWIKQADLRTNPGFHFGGDGDPRASSSDFQRGAGKIFHRNLAVIILRNLDKISTYGSSSGWGAWPHGSPSG